MSKAAPKFLKLLSCMLPAFLFLALAVHCRDAHALRKNLRYLSKAEVTANAALEEVPLLPFVVENYEIPLGLMKKQFLTGADPRIIDSLVFRRGGRKFVRWVIHPEDTLYHLQIENFLRRKGASTQRHRYFKAYPTASRSMIVEDPQSGVEFSIKVSTNCVHTRQEFKHHSAKDGLSDLKMSEYISGIAKDAELTHLIPLTESGNFTFDSVDQSMTIRSLDVLDANFFYIPGFSIFYGEVGSELALKNGKFNVQSFWENNYAGALGMALAELAAYFGLSHDSPHGQNFLVELDQNFKPTGRIVVRDLGDVYLARDYFKAARLTRLLKGIDKYQVINGKLQVLLYPLYSKSLPWTVLSGKDDFWKNAFLSGFESRFSTITNVSLDYLNSSQSPGVRGKVYNLAARAMSPYLDFVRAFHRGRCESHLVHRLDSQP